MFASVKLQNSSHLVCSDKSANKPVYNNIFLIIFPRKYIFNRQYFYGISPGAGANSTLGFNLGGTVSSY